MKKIIVPILLVVFMNNFDITALNLAVPLFTRLLHFTYSDIHLFSAIYLLSCGVFFVPAGYLGDQVGHIKIFFLGMLLFLIASFLMATTQAAAMFLIGRGIQGMSMALTLATTMPIIHKTYSNNAIQKITSVTLVIALSQAIGPILGALIIHNISWRYIFIINIPISIIALLISYPSLSIQNTSYTSSNSNILYNVITLLKAREYRLIVIIRGLFQFVYFGILFILPVYFLLVLNHTVIHTSYYILSITLGFSIISIIQIMTNIFSNNNQLLLIGLLCQILGCGLYCLFGDYPTYILLFSAGFIFGCGAALILPLSFAYALKYSPNSQKGIASGLMLCIAFIAGSLGAYISSHISISSASIQIQSIQPFTHVCLLYLLLLIIGLIFSLTLNNKGNNNAQASRTT